MLMAVCGFVCEATASATEIWVITDREHPVQIQLTPGARLIELDAPARLRAELSSKLPSDPTQASLIARQRMTSGGTELQERFVKAYQGVIDAWGLGITRIPAIVVDRRYVIYGETNIERAVARIEDYRRRTQR